MHTILNLILLITVLVVAFSSYAYADAPGGEAVNIGKLRSSAEEAFTNNEIDKSLSLWAKVISGEPNNAENFYKRFRVYLKKQDYNKALSDLTAVLDLNPKHEKALAQRAKYNLKLGNCDMAEKDFFSLKR